MPSVLIVSQFTPDHSSKGSASRLATIVEHLFELGLRIDFLHLGRRHEPVASLPIARRCLRTVRHVSLKHRAFSTVIPQQLRDAARPSRSAVWRQLHRLGERLQPTPPIETDIALAIRQTDPDLIWIDHTSLAMVVPKAAVDRQRTWVVDTHDVMHLRGESQRQAGLTADFEISRADETRLLRQFQLVIAIQDTERGVFEKMLPAGRVVTVGHAMPVRPLPARRPTVCFVGSRVGVNIHGIRMFIEQSWPAIAARCPTARLELAGSVCRVPELRRLAARGGERIVLRGMVPRLDDIYDGPAAMICPLWAGSGLKIKMVEALTYGKAIVTTPIGAQGLEQAAGRAFLMADSPGDFVEPVLRLLKDPAEREYWEAAATTFARSQFSARRVWGELDDELDRLLCRSKPPMETHARAIRLAA